MATMGEQIAAEISEITADRDKIRNKMIEIGEADSTANLNTLASAIAALPDNGAVSANVKEGETYNIPKGFHNGSGTVKGVSGGGNYTLQAKSVTPTKSQQNVTSDDGYYGLSAVTVGAIPAAYQDVSSVTAGAADVLANKTIVTPDGTLTAGTMPNRGAVSQVLDAENPSYTVPKGYHSGSGKVSIVPESKTVNPTRNGYTVTPTTGKVLTSVEVEPIPDDYVLAGELTAEQGHVLIGESFVGAERKDSLGTMPNNGVGDATTTLDTASTSYVVPMGYHDGKRTVKITTETKSVTPTKSSQSITPSSGKVLSKVTVAAIPAAYITTSDANATAAQILAGATAYVGGAKVTGSMANNGAVSKTIDGLTVTSATIPAGYTTGGTVSLTDDILNALKAI